VGICGDIPAKHGKVNELVRIGFEIIPSNPLKYNRSKQGLMILFSSRCTKVAFLVNKLSTDDMKFPTIAVKLHTTLVKLPITTGKLHTYCIFLTCCMPLL
jgi:hypothetical protein